MFRWSRSAKRRIPLKSPADFDALATVPGAYAVELLLDLPLAEVRRLVPAAYATLEETPRGVVVRGQAADDRDLALLAHTLAGFGRPLVVLRPPELRDALRALATHAAWLAEGGGEEPEAQDRPG